MPFSKDNQPIECIATSRFTHVMKQVEPNLWLNMVIQHPESLYCAAKGASGEDTVQANQDDGETIANTQFQYSQFTEDDSQIFYQLLSQYYAFIKLSHGYLSDQIKYHIEANTLNMFQEQLADFTRNFSKYFFTDEYCPNFFWNICFQGFFYCPIDKRSFLQAEFVQNGLLLEFEGIVEHAAVFHENYFICSSLPHL